MLESALRRGLWDSLVVKPSETEKRTDKEWRGEEKGREELFPRACVRKGTVGRPVRLGGRAISARLETIPTHHRAWI